MSYTIALVATDDTEYINCVKAISDESLLCALPYINIAEFDANHSQLEQIIDFYYVRPAIAKKKRDELNQKLIDAGKSALK